MLFKARGYVDTVFEVKNLQDAQYYAQHFLHDEVQEGAGIIAESIEECLSVKDLPENWENAQFWGQSENETCKEYFVKKEKENACQT